MAEKYEPKATARHKQMAKSKEQEVEAKKNRYEHEKVALRKYRDERKPVSYTHLTLPTTSRV